MNFSTLPLTPALILVYWHIQPFHSQEWSISSFPCSLTRNTASHIMKNLAFHVLIQMKDDYITNSHYLTYTIILLFFFYLPGSPVTNPDEILLYPVQYCLLYHCVSKRRLHIPLICRSMRGFVPSYSLFSFSSGPAVFLRRILVKSSVLARPANADAERSTIVCRLPADGNTFFLYYSAVSTRCLVARTWYTIFCTMNSWWNSEFSRLGRFWFQTRSCDRSNYEFPLHRHSVWRCM